MRAQQCRTGRVLLFEMRVVLVRSPGRVSALLAHVDLVSALLVCELELAAVHLATVRLQRTALRERLATLLTLVRTNSYTHTHTTYLQPCVPYYIEA